MKMNMITIRINRLDKKDLNYVKPNSWFNRDKFHNKDTVSYLMQTPYNFLAKSQASKLMHNEFMSKAMLNKNVKSKGNFMLLSNDEIDNVFNCLG